MLRQFNDKIKLPTVYWSNLCHINGDAQEGGHTAADERQLHDRNDVDCHR